MRHRRCECGPTAKLFEARAKGADATEKEECRPAEQGHDIMSIALLLLVSLALLALIYWAYDKTRINPTKKRRTQPRVIKTGEVSLKKVSLKDGTCCVTARTRLMATGKSSLWQVEISPGNWRDCGNDCEQALQKALDK